MFPAEYLKHVSKIEQTINSFLFAVLCTLAMAVRADNVYCDPKICPQGLQPHVACNVEPVREHLICV